MATHGPGTAYVYLNYGMHWLFNFLVKGDDEGRNGKNNGNGEGTLNGFVLIRALEPVDGMVLMQERRKRAAIGELCNGPAKLTQALGIHGAHHGTDPFSIKDWSLTAPEGSPEVLVSTRIGISQATDYPWRFLMKGSGCVSVPA